MKKYRILFDYTRGIIMQKTNGYLKKRIGMPWIIIVFFLMFCWPFGFYLVYRKAKKDKTAALKNAGWLKGIGWFWFGLGVIMLLSCIGVSDLFWPAVIGCLVIFCGGGIVMIISAKKLKKQGMLYKQYIDIIVNKEIYKIQEIANVLQVDRAEVIKTLQQMIEMGFFVNAKLDLEHYEIIIRKKGESLDVQMSLLNSAVVECKCCGAKNVVPLGGIRPCEYCDTYLEGQ